jgi:hypothetical protein
LKTISDQFATVTTIQNGFRKFGLFPFNKDDVDYTKFIPNRAIKTSENAPIDHIIIQITWRYKSLYNLYKVWLVIKNEDSTISNIDMDSVNQKADVDHNTSFTEEMIIGHPGTPRPENSRKFKRGFTSSTSTQYEIPEDVNRNYYETKKRKRIFNYGHHSRDV